MLAQARVKTITVHTRREAIVLFDELKDAINAAYESQSSQALSFLLAIVKIMHYLAPLPKFLPEINTIGTLPVTGFLENLLVKFRLNKYAQGMNFQGWITVLLHQFQKSIPSLDLREVKGLREFDSNKEEYKWQQERISQFISKALESSSSANHPGLFGSIIILFRNFLVFIQGSHGQIAQRLEWRQAIKYLSRGCWMLNNIARQETGISINYFLCLRQQQLCAIAVQNGTINYLLHILTSKYLFQSFGKRVVQFLKYLIFNASPEQLREINVDYIQETLSKFIIKYNKSSIISQVRGLMCFLEKKVEISHEARMDRIYALFNSKKQSDQQEIFKQLSILSLYAYNSKITELLSKDGYKFINFMVSSNNQILVKMLVELFSICFKAGDLGKSIGETIMTKLDKIVGDEDMKDRLNAFRKRILIDFVKAIRDILDNRQHYQLISAKIKKLGLDQKLWSFSDCTNYQFQREMIGLSEKLGCKTSRQNQKNIFYQLQEDFIQKSKTNFSKPSSQSGGEIALLDQLFSKSSLSNEEFAVHPDLPQTLGKYIHPNPYTAANVLDSLQLQEKEDLRKMLNLLVCKFLLKLARTNIELKLQRGKLLTLAASEHQLEETAPIVHKLINSLPSLERQKDVNDQESPSVASMEENIQSLIRTYFQDQNASTDFLVGLSAAQLEIVLTQMQSYESQHALPKFIRLLLQISQKDLHCISIFHKYSPNIAGIYGYILSNPDQSKRELVLLLENLLIRFIKMHTELCFNDHYMQPNYWLQIMSSIHSYFQVFFTKKRIILLDLIVEYLQINKILDHGHILSMLGQGQRKELILGQALNSKGEALGYCLGILLYSISAGEVEGLPLHHKQNVNRLLRQGTELVSVAKFVSLYYMRCEASTYNDFQLEIWGQLVVELLEGEMRLVQVITSQNSEAALRLRRINHFADTLNSLNQRRELSLKKSFLLAQEDILITSIKYLVYYIDMFQEQQFKKYYLGEMITLMIGALANLYRRSFKHLPVKGGDLIESFQNLLGISSDGIKDSLCETMRVLLLKKEVRMMNCQTFNTCKQYRESLPPVSQQHIYFCQRIQHILYEEGDLEGQYDNYFEETINNYRHDQLGKEVGVVDVPTASAYLIPEDSYMNEGLQTDPKFFKKQSIDLEEPLFLQFSSQPAISQQSLPTLLIQNKQTKSPKEVPLPSLSEIEGNSFDEGGLSRQGQFDGSTQIVQLLEKVWSEQEIIQAVQKYLEDPQSSDIKAIIDHLIPISSKKYCNLLMQLFLKTKNEFAQKKIPVSRLTPHETQEKIVSCMPAEFCQPCQELYEILNSGSQGASLGLKFKKVGLRGLEIYVKKFMNSLDLKDLSLYVRLLSNKKTFEELKYLKSCKLNDTIHQKFFYFTTGPTAQPLSHMADLIIETCKYPPLCSSYEIVPELSSYIITKSLDPTKRIPVLNILRHICRNSEKHRKQIQGQDFLGELLQILNESGQEEKSIVAQLLLLGAEENIEIGQFYQQANLEQTLLEILRQQIKDNRYHYQLFLNVLKMLQLLAMLPQSAVRIHKGGMMGLCKPVADSAIGAGNYDVIGCTVNILKNLMEELELNLSRVIGDLEREGLLAYLIFAGGYLPKCRQLQAYFVIFCRLITNSTINKKLLEKLETFLRIMNDLARDQLTTNSLLDQWLKVVFLLAEINRYAFLSEILKSNIFFSAANSLRGSQTISENILSMNNRMMRELSLKAQFRGLLAIHGYADFLVELLRMVNLPLEQYMKIINTLADLFKNRHFTSKLCTQLFAVVMVKLQAYWKDEIALSSITLLKSIKKNVEVTTEFGSMMLQFFGKFLTQSTKINSQEYYSISRQVICLLSYFLIFNEQIRILFRNKIILDVLKNWNRIAKAMDYADMAQSYKLFHYSVYCQKSLHIDLCDINSKRISEVEAMFEKGWRCKLYRLNGTYKEAILKIDKSKVEITAFKFPDGIIKDKYRIHWRDLLIIQRYQTDKDISFAESVFTKAVNPFQHKVNPRDCLTILCLTEQGYQVREISIEIERAPDLEDIYNGVKILASKWAENQIEEQSRLWQMVNKKVL